MFAGTYISVHGLMGAPNWMPASGLSVFTHKEFWRLWTSLFAHGDVGHLLSNALVFFPFAYFLSAYFSLWFFPIAAVLLGGFINAIVLWTMPPEISLIGFSGVVHWMGAAYLTLYLLIERGEDLRRRIAKVVMISVVLFVPEIYRPEVSYLSHFVGYLAGIGSALIYFRWNKERFRAAEVIEYLPVDDFPANDFDAPTPTGPRPNQAGLPLTQLDFK